MRVDDLYSQRTKYFRTSEIRELLELSQRPDVISFAGGLPSPHAFPVEEIKEIVERVLSNDYATALQYGPTPGLKIFRETITEYVKNFGINADIDDVFITVGSQQALDIVGRVFIDAGDVIFVSLPTYLGAINAFYAYGANMVGVPLDEEGMRVDILEEKIKELKKKGEKLKLIYTVPTFQNPAGVELSEERRKHLLEIAAEHDLLIVEDEPYSMLRFEGEPIPSIKSMDKEGRVIYMGTFSKIMSPGFRLAYVVAEKSVARKMVVAKQSMDLCAPTFTQVIAKYYVENGYLTRRVEKIIEMYRKKRDIMLDAMDEYFPQECKWTKPRGGMFLWVELPEHINTVEMVQDAVKEKVAYVHGRAFHVDGGGTNAMRLNFTNPDDDVIEEGIKRLAKVIKTRM
ncbi:MAG: PLP-dependent aminotransferase family protein [Thermoplasmata archaeon]|nr:PLP-dependent aminotransferase family protein [Thermoplasmata archaeon]